MRKTVIVALALVCVTAARAQQADPAQSSPAEQAPPAATAAPAAPAAPAMPRVDHCRAQGIEQRLRGQPLIDFVQVCRLEARIACLKDAIAKKINGPARRDYLKSCDI